MAPIAKALDKCCAASTTMADWTCYTITCHRTRDASITMADWTCYTFTRRHTMRSAHPEAALWAPYWVF
jgi:hypothetical protein